MFYECARQSELKAAKVDLKHVIDDLTRAPDGYRLSDLMITGCTMVLVPESN